VCGAKGKDVTGNWRRLLCEERQVCTVRDMTQAFKSEARVQSQASICGICGGQCEHCDRFVSRDVSYPCQSNSTNAPSLPSFDTSLCQKDNREVVETSQIAVHRLRSPSRSLIRRTHYTLSPFISNLISLLFIHVTWILLCFNVDSVIYCNERGKAI
jgi:hypothetical protein